VKEKIKHGYSRASPCCVPMNIGSAIEPARLARWACPTDKAGNYKNLKFKQMKKTILLIAIIFSFISCYSQKHKITKSDIIGCWVHSNEECNPDSAFTVYRPCDYKELPPRRFRYKVEFKKGKNCSWLALSPSDKHEMQDGKWKYKAKEQKIEIFDKSGTLVKTFHLIKISKDMMKAKSE